MSEQVSPEQALAQLISDVLNAGRADDDPVGFVLIYGPYRSGEKNYIASIDREDRIAFLREVLARFEGQPYIEGEA